MAYDRMISSLQAPRMEQCACTRWRATRMKRCSRDARYLFEMLRFRRMVNGQRLRASERNDREYVVIQKTNGACVVS